MRLRVARPSTLIDIGRIEELSAIREDGDEIVIGALARHHDVANSELLQRSCPIVAFAAAQIGDPQVRHVGTIGGSVAHGDPAGDMPAVLLALDATFVAPGPGGDARRSTPRSFFTGLFETALAPTEVLTEIRVPEGHGRVELPEVQPARPGLGVGRGLRGARRTAGCTSP